MLQVLRSVLLVLVLFTSFYSTGQVPLITFPDLTSITFHEQTGIVTQHTYAVNDGALTTHLIGQLNAGNRDFEGWVNNEFYDVFYSDADGTFNVNGDYISIECRFDMNSGGGALNINEVEFHFGSGNSLFGSYVPSFVSHGSNYLPGTEEWAADCNLATASTMGNTLNTSIRLRVTIGILNAASTIIEEACSESGYEVVVGNSTFNEANPAGTEVLTANNGCDSLVYVDLTFNEIYFQEINYTGCSGDGYAIVVGNTIYNENNPSGTEVLMTQENCDSTILVDLVFYSVPSHEINYQGCEGDGYSINVNGTSYNESNPEGTETLMSANGCDSIVTIDLTFAVATFNEIVYNGCSGDHYAIVVNGTTYDETNPEGVESLINANGCDSMVTIDLAFADATSNEIDYIGCSGDHYGLIVNGTTYDESNPEGVEWLMNENGCDSIVTIELVFNPVYTADEIHTSCSGSGYEIVVNGNTYDEGNPFGTEWMTSVEGCDSIIDIELTFLATASQFVSYSGCTGDGYAILVHGTTYNEANPAGQEILTAANGCDSLVTISLSFLPVYTVNEFHTACMGSGYSLVVNGTVYDEHNTSGVEVFTSQTGCDSIVHIQLDFTATVMGDETYSGCLGDGYSVTVNGTIYNELNPSGIEILTGQGGCDSVVTINLMFQNIVSVMQSYTGCVGDGYAVVINGNVYNESNPNGVEIIQGTMGCDTSVTIQLNFQPIPNTSISYVGCEGDGYEVLVNGTAYNVSNPQGTEILTAQNGCDSIITISLNFLTGSQHAIQYAGCIGDNYSIFINGTLYNEMNPTGTELLTGSNGCDSIVNVNLVFGNQFIVNENYSGCAGDGYFILVNGNLYNEQHPIGTENIQGVSGCDTLVEIDLAFAPPSFSAITYAGCSGDGYAVSINGTVYDESHPGGTVYLVSNSGCDSILDVALTFSAVYDTLLSYLGCTGDGYVTVVNGNIYNEQHPNGVEIMTTADGCDSMVTVAMSFANMDTTNIAYTGCMGDGYSLTINGSSYNESNPSGVEMMQTVYGCDSTIQVSLIYEDCYEEDLDCAIYIPNVISPNDDGINDDFGFGYTESCEITSFHITLFDRWGEELFDSTDPSFNWKGDFKGKQLQPGVYVYVAKIDFNGSSRPVIRRGDLTLIR